MEETKKSYLVVAIARTMGSGGSIVGKRLATRLGCRYLDREILLEAARRMNKEPDALEAYDERHLTFWERTRMAYAFGAPDAPYAPPPVNVDDMDLFETEKTIILEAALRGPAVVLGRAGFAILRGEPGLLSVLLHAPLERRAKRVMKVYKLGSLEEARDLITRTDRDRGQFVKAVAATERLDPRNYDLCIDTARLGTGATIELVYQAAMEVSRGLGRSEAESP
jgi:cytidylate kinase